MEEFILDRINLIALCSAVVLSCVFYYVSERSSAIKRGWVRFVGSSALCYLLIVAMVFAASYYIGWRVDGFDLNGDGVLTAGEVTDPSASYLLRLDVQDTARTFIPFTAIVFALFATVVGCGVSVARKLVDRVVTAR